MCHVVRGLVSPDSPYSKQRFVEYLRKSHCTENLEFYEDLAAFMDDYHSKYEAAGGTSDEWTCMYDKYIGPEIINLSAELTAQTDRQKIPAWKVLHKIQHQLAAYLHMSYQQFVHETTAEFSDSSDQDPGCCSNCSCSPGTCTPSTCDACSPSTCDTNDSNHSSTWSKIGRKFRFH